jgi:hypothetical protein
VSLDREESMMVMRLVPPIVAAALLAACAGTAPIASSRGIALRIDDSVTALEAAQDEAEDHCRRYDRYPVLRSVSQAEDDQLLASFECAEDRGSGVAIYVGSHDENVRQASAKAEGYCHDYHRVAVLQSVSNVGGRRVATFSCSASKPRPAAAAP